MGVILNYEARGMLHEVGNRL